MADQPGYTRIPNEIIEAMPLLGNAELRVLLAIARKTLGWQKECDRISVSQLATATGLTSRNTQSALTSLLEKGLIVREPAGKQTYCYSIKPYPLGTQLDNHIPSDTMSPRDTVPYPLGTQLNDKPYPLGITQKKDLKEKKERGREARAPTPPKQINLSSLSEAVEVYKSQTGVKAIPPATANAIADTVIDLPHWSIVLAAWLGAGFNPKNTTGMLDWYLHPDKMTRKNGSNGNGTTNRSLRSQPRQDIERARWTTDLDRNEPL